MPKNRKVLSFNWSWKVGHGTPLRDAMALAVTEVIHG
jgi:hypothetical protein